MRILIAAHGFPPLQNAGAEKAAERIATWLAAQGHQVHVFALNRLDQPETCVESENRDGMTIHRLSLDLKQGGGAFQNSYDNPAAGRAFDAVLAQYSFDLVHVISGYLLAGQVIHTARRAGIPVVLTLTEYFFLCPRLNLMHADASMCTGPDSDKKCARCMLEEKRRYRYPARLAPGLMEVYWKAAAQSGEMRRQAAEIRQRSQTLQAALEAANLVICPSRFIIEKHREYGIDPTNFQFIQHGVNRPAAGLPARGRRPETLRIGYIGQIKVHKGVDLLVEAARGMLDAGCRAEFQIWGRTTEQPGYSKRLMQLTRDYPQIHWKGGFVGEQLWDVLAGLDVLVVPSRWYENCPTVILEAYAAGVPVVATNLGGMAELVQPGKSGLLFELNQAAGLRAHLERLIHEPDLLEDLRAGIPYVKTAGEEVSEIYAQYARLLDKNAAGQDQ